MLDYVLLTFRFLGRPASAAPRAYGSVTPSTRARRTIPPDSRTVLATTRVLARHPQIGSCKSHTQMHEMMRLCLNN